MGEAQDRIGETLTRPERISASSRLAGVELILLEARARIELANKGFADLCLTTWLPRLKGFH